MYILYSNKDTSLQNMMEKYPEVEVKVFRGGENVGK